MGKISYSGQFHASRGKVSVDPRLMDVMKTAAAMSGMDVQFVSGVADRSAGTHNHDRGYAVDVQLIDPATGKALPNYQNGPAFSKYEQLAQTARVIQTEKYPELDKTFRWGGYFNSSKGASGYGAVDLMHFDITPSLHGATGLGSWTTGANSALLKAYPGAETNGGLGSLNGQRFAEQVKGQLSDPSLVPPENIPSVGTDLSTTAVEGQQRALAKAGFDPGPIDGNAGPRTTSAIKAFQQANGLTPDGVIGPRTSAKLAEVGGAAPETF